MNTDEVTEQSVSYLTFGIGFALTVVICLWAAVACDLLTPANFGG